MDKKLEVDSPLNHFLYKKSGSTVINKDIALLEQRYTLEDSWKCHVPQLHVPFLKICWQCVRAIQSSKVQLNPILDHDGIGGINCCINELRYTKHVKIPIILINWRLHNDTELHHIPKSRSWTYSYIPASLSQLGWKITGFSFPTGASKNFHAVHVDVEEFHQTNQETFIWLLAMEVAINQSLLFCIFGYKEVVA